MKTDPAPIKKAILVLMCLLIFQVVAGFFGKTFWLNFTESEPVGLYHMEKPNREIRRGDMVIMSIPGPYQKYVYGRKWLSPGWPLLKHVGAVAGDQFCSGGDSFWINGVSIGPVFSVDSQGLPLPRLGGCRQVPYGHFLPVATGVKTSFDGRYMGPVSLSEIRGLVRPIWVF